MILLTSSACGLTRRVVDISDGYVSVFVLRGFTWTNSSSDYLIADWVNSSEWQNVDRLGRITVIIAEAQRSAYQHGWNDVCASIRESVDHHRRHDVGSANEEDSPPA
jgi:hypothetical protein